MPTTACIATVTTLCVTRVDAMQPNAFCRTPHEFTA